MCRTRLALTTVLVLALGSLCAPGVTTASGGQGPAVADLAWLTGTWAGTQGTTAINETWLAPEAEAMFGVHRDVAGGKVVGFEFLRIATEADGSVVYWASPGGQPATPFRLVESAAQRVVFANPEHDFPQRILYWIADDGRLHARIEGPGKDGKTAGMEWAWERRTP